MLESITCAAKLTKMERGFGLVHTRIVSNILGAAANVVPISMSTLGEFMCATSANTKPILWTRMTITSVSADPKPRVV